MRRAGKALLGFLTVFALLIAFAPWIRAQMIPFGGGGGSGSSSGSSWCAEPGTDGIVARVSSLSCTARTIIAGTGVVMTNGDMVSGNAVVDIDTATTPQFSNGTATPAAACGVASLYLETDRNHLWWCTSTNTWTDIGPNAFTSPLPATDGGTGQTTATQGDILYASAANTWSKLAAGTNGFFLKTQGAGANPAWAAVSASVGTMWAGNNGNNTVAASTTTFAAPFIAAFSTEATRQWVVPAACTARNMFIRTNGTQNAGGTLVMTLRLNGASQAIVATVAAGGGSGNYSDTSNTVAVAAGDLLAFQLVNNYSGGVSAQVVGVSLQCN